MKDPLVTVYVTNYNYGHYIRLALDSLYGQTFCNFEIIIIDDGSTDGSRDIIADYAGRSETRIIFQENKGLNATNKVAVKAARGKYVMRLDADDILDENALLVMANTLEAAPDVALVFPDFYYIDETGPSRGRSGAITFSGTSRCSTSPPTAPAP